MAPAQSLEEVIRQVEADSVSPDPLERLRTASSVVGQMSDTGDAALGYFVDQARRVGNSWSEIGDALGVSKQAAQQRHTRPTTALNGVTFERFTPRARNVMAAALPAAVELGHLFVGTEHLLLAQYAEPEGISGRILLGAGLSRERVKQAILARVPSGAHGTGVGADDEDVQVPYTPKATSVFSSALSAALEFGHNYIGTEHLLIGLARTGGVGAEVMVEFGLTTEAVTEKVMSELAGFMKAQKSSPPAGG
ncbi:MAG TPA: Clp protease N-terminal domain-containing protein [Candidatus Saccharimonadales bacterium]|nr:Clp protease N-terminal domain-containing protein [Candidatus Saccharimonadales bacterium]